ncbi:translocation/assembly module TamB domain-containing protein [Chitinophaga sp. S165]|uniref:translocation/assembly module TamB domain-containing protein n=1 Tax=Chitinophaga sp. S165 TaxID=2135462 RepID=UPI000D717AC6|nr:translocation/assembly module TamB domain-containing protein [Chitinophaga sp. S165]PWV57111.1 uncharacterized protein DUF490 [Chitinophaga sp. S165]
MIFLSLLGLVILIGVLVNIPVVQNFLVHQATERLSEQLRTKVEIEHVNIRLFNSLRLEGTLIEDRHKDTLLYARVLQLRITDWFFFQDKPVIKFIGLEDADVNLVRHRNDSVWNYQFIIDEFSAPPDTTRKPQKGSGGVAFDLRKTDLRNVRINQIDAWIGEDMRVAAKRIYVDAKNIDLNQHNIDIQEMTLDKPTFIISRYPASPLRKKRPAPPAAPLTDTAAIPALRWNSANWKLLVKEMSIKDGTFGVDDLEDPTPVQAGHFAPNHIRFNSIDLSLSNTSLVKDSILGDLTMNTKERSGFEVKKLTARFKMSPVEMEFSHMDLLTNRSHLRDYYTMQYADISDMNGYVDEVYMRAHIVNSTLHSDDIAYFAPELSDWKREITLSGDARGPVSNLKATNIQLQSGTTTSLKGGLEMRGLPDINDTYIDFTAEELLTTGADIISIAPEMKNMDPLQLDRLTNIRFTGTFTGFVNDFVAYGKFQTNLGNLNSDINFKTNRDVPVYSGSLTTDAFNVGTLLNVPELSTISLSAKLNGEGFNFKTLKADVDADVRQITLNGYDYTNIKTKGDMNRKFFNGSLTVNDPNLDMDFAGTIDFNDSVPVFDFDSDIRHANLRSLKMTRDSIVMQAKMALNFAGDNIDNFNGSARVYNVSLFKDQRRLEFDSLNVSTHLENNVKVLAIQGSEIGGYVKGNYSFMQLPDAFRLLLNKYYPSYFPDAPKANIQQDFSFAFQLGQVDKLIRGFSKDISGFDNSTVEGALNTISGNLALNVNVPLASYRNYHFEGLQLKSTGTFDKIDISTSITKVSSGDRVWLQHPLILANSGRDTSYIKVDLQAVDSSSLDGFYARVITVADGVKVSFLNSAFTVNERQWNVTPGNEIYWSKDFLTIHNLQVTRNEQSITVETNEFNPDESKFIVNLKNLNLSDVIPYQLTSMRIEGFANGNINISDPTHNLDIESLITFSELRIDNDSIGLVAFEGGYKQETSDATFSVRSENKGKNFFAEGLVGVSETNNRLEANVELNGTSLSVLDRFVSDYVTDLKGMVSGKLAIAGTTKQPSVHGNLRADSVGVKVLYLGTHYTIPRLNLNIDDNLIEFGNFFIVDKNNSRATASGYISHDHFNNLNFDFDVTARNFVFLNTGAADSDLFYGNVIADGKVYFSGPLNDLQLRIQARPGRTTHFYLPLSDSKDIGRSDYITFKSYGTEMKDDKKKKKDNVKLNVKLDITATPDAQIDVIMDAASGDMISANGTGNLQIQVNTEGDFNMFGNYEINNGSYNFTLQRLTSWKFDIDKNSSITWNGDPTEAKVDIHAKYHLSKVSLYNLVGSASTAGDKLATRTETVDILINLRNELMKPDITYEIKLPEVGSLAYESGVAAKLREINQDQNKALQQMAGLLLFNQFLPEDPNSAGAASVTTTGKNSVGQALSAQASAILNNITGALLKNSGIGINVNYRAYNIGSQDNASLDRNQVSAGVTSNLYNNRIRLYVGGDYDWGKASTSANANRFAGDFRAEYLLTPEGRLRINAFSKSDYDVYNLVNRNKAGLGISYVREYNKFSELFNERNRRRLIDSFRRAEFIRQEEIERKQREKEDSVRRKTED